jgi:hypothetical protein
LGVHKLHCLLDNTIAKTIVGVLETWMDDNRNLCCLHTCGNGSVIETQKGGAHILYTCTVHTEFGARGTNISHAAAHKLMRVATSEKEKTLVFKLSATTIRLGRTQNSHDTFVSRHTNAMARFAENSEDCDTLRELERAACMAGKTKYTIVNVAEV